MKRGRRKDNTPKQQKIAEDMYTNGKRRYISEIAAEVGVSPMTIYRWIKKYGWQEKYRKWYEEELLQKSGYDRLIFKGLYAPKTSKKSQKT